MPTASVFDTLVPTLRRQRRQRQFIIASHDANVVVAGDVERVVVLPGDPGGDVLAGSLFEAGIRESAMNLLEGGSLAFERRRRRYGAM